MKPRQKIVTAQDIQNSLYYLHVDSPGDESLREAVHSSQDLGVERGHSEPQNHLSDDGNGMLRRKPPPVLSQLNSSTDSPQLPSQAYPYLQPPSYGPQKNVQLGRKPVNSPVRSQQMVLDRPPTLPTRGPPMLFPRRPLGPRSLHERLHSVDSAALGAEARKENNDPRRWSEASLGTPYSLPMPEISRKDVNSVTGSFLGGLSVPDLPDDYVIGQQNDGRGHVPLRLRDDANSMNTHRPARHRSKDFSITVIRRDPASGGQWNVGKISSLFEGRDSGVPIVAPQSGSRHGVTLEIMTTGYDKFIDTTNTRPLPSLATGSGASLPASVPSIKTPSAYKLATDAPPFRRQLITRRASSGDEKRRSKSVETQHKSSGSHPGNDLRRGSEQSAHLMETNDITSLSAELVSPQIKAYTFLSPWNGVCEFTTGIAGRSLKCKHTLPFPSPSLERRPSSYPVSEIRFNLPSSNIFSHPLPKQPDARSSKRSSVLSPSSLHRTSSSARTSLITSTTNEENNDSDVKMDLSLGQEHAGGGFGGKQAKLGKLIIEDEGLKMLDLVVAANMGIWWGSYERASRE